MKQSLRYVPTRMLVLLLLLLHAGATAHAQTSYPMLMSLTPVAAQVGTSSEHVVEARYSMYGVRHVVVSGEGVRGEVVTEMKPDAKGNKPSLTKITVRFTVDANARPGVRDFRLIGPTGPSTLGQLVVVREPVVAEVAANDTIETAQQIAVPAALCGCVEKAEDVDFFRFRIEQPTTLTFHCLGMRLEDRIHDLQTHVDPIITLRHGQTGSTLASVDNTFAADPLLSYDFTPGEYLLEVRDVRYSGNRYWNYCIEITDRPFIKAVHPLAVQADTETELQLTGLNIPDDTRVSWKAPAADGRTVVLIEPELPNGVCNPRPVIVSSLPVVTESETPNNDPEHALAVSVPAMISGQIEQEADIDVFAFTAKKGQRFRFEVHSRRYGSDLDPIIGVLDANGRRLTENDDLSMLGRLTVQDSRIESWTAPADGTWYVEIRDVHLRGGRTFPYALSMTLAEPWFELVLDSDKTWLAPGTSSAVFARVVRHNGFSGDVQLSIDGLPDHVTAECGRIPDGKVTDGCIILTADANAEAAAESDDGAEAGAEAGSGAGTNDGADGFPFANVVIKGTATVGTEDGGSVVQTVVGQPMQETYMPGGGRSHWPVDMYTVAVAEPGDILDVRVSTQHVELKPGESKTVDVEIVRADGFDKNVTLDMLYQHLSTKYANTLPEGVTIDLKKSKTLLTGSQTKGAITLTAAASAPPTERQQCCVMANVSINFVMKATFSSRPVLVSVLKKDE